MNKKLISIFLIILLFGTILYPVTGLGKKFMLKNETDFDNKINFLMKIGHMPSLSTCIIKNDSVIWSKSYGNYDLKKEKPATQDTIYMVGSISKMFAALAIMQLYEEGLFDLDDNISNYLPYHIYNPKYPDINITFRMLLSHQSSLADSSISLFLFFSLLGYPYDWLNEFLCPGGYIYNPRNWKNYPPGEEHEYSSLAFEILGYLVEKISNQSLEKYCKKNIFEPLDMKSSSFYLTNLDIDKIAIPYFWLIGKYFQLPLYENRNSAAGGLKSTIRDLSHFLIVHLNDGVYNGTRILKKSTIDLMQTIQYPNGSDGFAWKYVKLSNGKVHLIHSGTLPGYHSRTSIYPPDKIGIIYSYNQHNNIFARENIRFIGRIEKYAFEQIEILLYEKGYEIQ
jgi:CubicO group peptidase (beta-lactamase class C family)